MSAAIVMPNENPYDYCGPCRSGRHDRCYPPCLCADRGHRPDKHRHALTPVQGGHVSMWTWEDFAARRDVACVACGISLKSDGRLITERGEEPDAESNLCPGWIAKPIPEMPVLPDLVRGIAREAPNDQPNGPVEEALADLCDASAFVLAKPASAVVRTAEDAAVKRLGYALADQVRALRLALEHDERCGR